MRTPFLLRRSLMTLGLLCLNLTVLPTVKAVEEEAQSTGISFYNTRVIFTATSLSGVTQTLYNKTDNAWLLQSLIRPVDAQTGDVDIDNHANILLPFIATPPLERLDAHSDITLRIRRNDVPLPDDRESVFYLTMKAIPAQPKHAESNTVTLAVVSSMKVFFRPVGLKRYAVEEASNAIRFRKQGNQLIAINPTPYWLTFAVLRVGSHDVDKAQRRLMVPPKGEREYHFPSGTQGQVTWQLIDEDAWLTPLKHQDSP